ncbi:hypothetical protein [Bradyrhizobium sp. Ec3.3]|uniref:hypothetical protein n=1 Tax=Bradyrhizobium sp. Ec3.3 TaxID=189753 RepID=UPI000403ABA8|nr:hypothetical protein [Bradyrhizobium sp. Ec3.3]
MNRLNLDPLGGSVALVTLVYLLLRAAFGPVWVINIVGWIALVGLCILFFRLAMYLRELVKVLLAMWLPVTVTTLAGILLFYEGQGRDLGVGLLGEGQGRLFLLFWVLVYWAVNNWHSARLGLNYAFPQPTGAERWLFWPPRLLGVCAHFFAAMSLALAAWGLTSFTRGSSSVAKLSDLLVFTAPIVIALVTASVWAFDYSMISRRPGRSQRTIEFARWLRILMPLCACALIACLAFASYFDALAEGLLPGTLWISASACMFLVFVSIERNTFSAALSSHAGFTIGLAAIAFSVGTAIWYSPTGVGTLLGSLNVCLFGFAASLAVLNLFGLLASCFIDASRAVERVRAAASAIAFLLVLAALNSVLRDFHRVRLCTVEVCSAAPPLKAWSPIKTPSDRPTVRQAAQAWYKQAAASYASNPAHLGKPVPMIVVATAGGGIRAAYWTATVLERLEVDLKARGEKLENLIFAISGVSGGSVGAMEYVAALHDRAASGSHAVPTAFLQTDFLAASIASLVFVDGPSNFLPDLGQNDRGTALELSLENSSSGYLAHSFLSFFPDANSASERWTPSLLLNATHQETGRRIIASNLKIERDVFLDSFDELDLVGSDMRASTVAHNSARFTYVSPAGKLEPKGGNGFLFGETNRGYVIDGGYFENYGAVTALELARDARRWIEKENGNGAVKLVVLQISSDPTLTKERTRVRIREDDVLGCVLTTSAPAVGSTAAAKFLPFKDSGWNLDTRRWEKNDGEGWVVSYLNELAAPLQGVTAVRDSHGTLAAAELAASVCAERDALRHGAKSQPAGFNLLLRTTKSQEAEATIQSMPARPGAEPHFAHLAMCEVSENGEAPIVPPLGWVLSGRMQANFPNILKDCGNDTELKGLEAALD